MALACNKPSRLSLSRILNLSVKVVRSEAKPGNSFLRDGKRAMPEGLLGRMRSRRRDVRIVNEKQKSTWPLAVTVLLFFNGMMLMGFAFALGFFGDMWTQ